MSSFWGGVGKIAFGVTSIALAPVAGAAATGLALGAGAITGIVTTTAAVTAATVAERSVVTVGVSTAAKGAQEIIEVV